MHVHRFFYGKNALQFGDLRVPEGAGHRALAVVIHGGFWRNRYGLEYMAPFCEAFTDAGIATWNVEYRRIGDEAGGWPGTFEDLADAADHVQLLADEFPLDLNRTITIGHSAGGHLAMWLAAERKWLQSAFSLAGVLDLRRAWELQLSSTVVAEFLGGSPEEVPGRYAFASPIERLPLDVPQRVFHGTADTSVPYEIGEQYAKAAHARGDDVELITFEGTGHFELVDPRTSEFGRIRDSVLQSISV